MYFHIHNNRKYCTRLLLCAMCRVPSALLGTAAVYIPTIQFTFSTKIIECEREIRCEWVNCNFFFYFARTEMCLLDAHCTLHSAGIATRRCNSIEKLNRSFIGKQHFAKKYLCFQLTCWGCAGACGSGDCARLIERNRNDNNRWDARERNFFTTFFRLHPSIGFYGSRIKYLHI